MTWQAITIADDLPSPLPPRRLCLLPINGGESYVGYLACPFARPQCPPICLPAVITPGANPPACRNAGVSTWQIASLNPLTLSPSVWQGHLANPDRPDGCACHFDIKNGEIIHYGKPK